MSMQDAVIVNPVREGMTNAYGLCLEWMRMSGNGVDALPSTCPPPSACSLR